MSTNSGIKHAKRNRGTSLIEVALAVAIGAVIASMFSVVAIEGMDSIRSAKRTERLHASGMVISDTVSTWMKQNNSFTVPDSHTFSVVFPDNSTKVMTLNGSMIEIDGVPLIADEGIAIDRFFVQKMARSVEIAFTVRAEDYNEILSATTTIADRH